MCGIFGSNNREQFLSLQKLNLKRGDFAQSNLLINKEGYEVHKIPMSELKNSTYRFPKKRKFDLYLGHVQAPTSTKRTFDLNTTHPFIVENWIVAHNGVLTNFKELVDEYQMPYSNPVDTSIIPYMLYKNSMMYSKVSEVNLITDCLSKLKGTFGLWIFNAYTANTFLARCGVTLFADVYENTFSSIKQTGFIELEEGILHQVTPEGITPVGDFDCDSPFFTL
jgi:glucosamine 6-phosphate synthetase-like amidotransferase/phosphosugar isomerase protein